MNSPVRSLEDEPIYTFRYTLFDVVVQLKQSHLIAKMGIKTHVIPIEEIEFLYRRHIKQQGVYELTIAFRRDQKLKRARLYSDPHQEDFDALWDELLWLKPEANISHLNLRESFSKMGSHDLPWLVIPSLMASTVLLLSILGAPLLIHGLDQGHWRIDLERIYQDPSLLKQPPSHNISIEGLPALDRSFTLMEGSGETTQPHILIPLYPKSTAASYLPLASDKAESASQMNVDAPHYAEGEALVVLSLRGRSLTKLDQIKNGESVEGILRTIWWEGLGYQSRRGLLKSGAKLSPEVSLIEVGVKRRDDLQIYVLFVCLLSGLTLLVALYLKPYQIRERAT